MKTLLKKLVFSSTGIKLYNFLNPRNVRRHITVGVSRRLDFFCSTFLKSSQGNLFEVLTASLTAF